jgi:hypothetical protein
LAARLLHEQPGVDADVDGDVAARLARAISHVAGLVTTGAAVVTNGKRAHADGRE